MILDFFFVVSFVGGISEMPCVSPQFLVSWKYHKEVKKGTKVF